MTCVHEKYLCPFGVVCTADMTIFPNVPYTGLLSSCKDQNDSNITTPLPCIVRLSSAMRPPSMGVTSTMGRTMLHTFFNAKVRNAQLFPCAAIKVFRDNNNTDQDTPSGNLLFGGSKLGQREVDFFSHCLCTSMTEQMPRLIKPLVRKFWTYSDYPLSLGISDFCKTSVDGTVVDDDNIVFPFAVILRPCVETTNSTNSDGISFKDSFDNFIDCALAFPNGTKLYDIFACPDPSNVPDASKLQRIGKITMTSKMIPSSSTDGLIFRHQKKEDDYNLRPHWPMALKNHVSISSNNAVTNGTIGQLAGWKLFEEQILEQNYVDFEEFDIDKDVPIDNKR